MLHFCRGPGEATEAEMVIPASQRGKMKPSTVVGLGPDGTRTVQGAEELKAASHPVAPE